MKIRPFIGRRIRIGRQLHMNQPLNVKATFHLTISMRGQRATG